MARDFEATLTEVDEFFMKKGPVHETLDRLTARLSNEGIAYVLIGGMALAAHGLVRPTEDVDVLMTGEGLERFRATSLGLGYVPAFDGAAKTFRDTTTGIRVEVLTEGEFPGDGEPKPVAFPDPSEVAVEISGISVVQLATLVELKLASGLSAAHRLKDLADVQELIAKLHLAREMAEELDASVRPEFLRLWDAVESARQLGFER